MAGVSKRGVVMADSAPCKLGVLGGLLAQAFNNMVAMSAPRVERIMVTLKNIDKVAQYYYESATAIGY